MAYKQPLRFAMIGGGEGSYIGNIYRIATRMDGWQLADSTRAEAASAA